MSEPIIDPAEYARLIAEATDEQLEDGMSANRDLILGEVFNTMPSRLIADRARDQDYVVEWRIRRDAGGADRWQVHVHDGACTVTRDGDAQANTTFTCGPVDFIKLVTGNAAGPRLFLFGRLKIEGDLMLALRFQGMFRLPKPGSTDDRG